MKRFLGALFIVVWTAFWSEGFIHMDEHFQLFELIGLKMGSAPNPQLMWEHAEKIRPGTMVFIGTQFCKLLQSFGITSPFHWALALRLLSGLLGLLALWIGAQILTSNRSKNILLLFFALVPLLIVRFSSESWSMTLFFLGAALIWRDHQSSRPRPMLRLLGALLCGLAFECRFQIALMMIGPAIAMLLLSRQRMRRLCLATLGFFAAFLFGRLCDFWLYGEWVLTPLRYFITNIVQDVASTHGTDAPWAYALWVLLLAPPLGLWLLAKFGRNVLLSPWSLAGLVTLPFLSVHHLIPHKELRFLIPVLPWILVNASLRGRALWVVNFIYLALLSTMPMRTEVRFYRELWSIAPKGATLNYVYQGAQDPLNRLGAVLNFYTQATLHGRRLSEQDFAKTPSPQTQFVLTHSRDFLPYERCHLKASEIWPPLLSRQWSRTLMNKLKIRPLRLYECPHSTLQDLMAQRL
jgi:hypothetical protein